MEENRVKDNFTKVPVEKHDTAAWADTYGVKPISNVSVPSEFDVKNAKEYVDSNEK